MYLAQIKIRIMPRHYLIVRYRAPQFSRTPHSAGNHRVRIKDAVRLVQFRSWREPVAAGRSSFQYGRGLPEARSAMCLTVVVRSKYDRYEYDFQKQDRQRSHATAINFFGEFRRNRPTLPHFPFFDSAIPIAESVPRNTATQSPCQPVRFEKVQAAAMTHLNPM